MSNPVTEVLDRLNSATKYPSIPTYHALDDRGRITAGAEPQVDFAGEEVIVTEKVDGSNARLIVLEHDWFVGSREELLTAAGDRLWNPAQRIVEALRPVLGHAHELWHIEGVQTLYVEAFGARIGSAGKAYAGGGDAIAVRAFDVSLVPSHVLDMPRAEIARWRDGGGQRWCNEEEVAERAARLGIDVTPRLSCEAPPRDPSATKAWLAQFSLSRCALGYGCTGISEGVVVRTPDRSKIAKIRFDDYRRFQ